MSEQKIYNSLFADFVTSSLPTEEMRVVCKSLRDSGEYNSAMESSIINYKVSTELADEMLGIDTELHQTEKNVEAVVRNANIDDSNVVDNQNSTIKKNNIMNNNFSNETINMIVSAINDNMSDIQAMRTSEASVEVAGQKLLVQKYGLSEMEASEIIEDLKKGISEFENQMVSARTQNNVSVEENLSKLSEDMDDEKRIEYYASILTALQLLTSDEKNANEIESVLSENKALSIDELVAKIDQTLNESISLDVIGNSVKKELNAETMAELTSKIEMNKEDFRLNTALWIYILQRDGKIKLTDSEIGLPASTIGSMAAAGVETIITTNEYIQGNISLSTWQVVMKWILGSLIFACLFVASVTLVCYGALSFLSILLSLFGTGTLAIMVSFVMSMLAAWSWTETLSGVQFLILEKLGEIYDKYIPVLTQKVNNLCAILKAMLVKAKEVVVEKAKETQEKISNAATTTSTSTENDIEVQPVMA